MNLAPASSSGGFMGIGRNINHERLDDLRRGRGPVQEHIIDEFVEGRLSRREFIVFTDHQGNYHPWLATSWSANSDATVWTFKIRQGVKFNDGTPMTVDDVVYSFKSQSDPKSSANALSVFGGLLSPDGVQKVD